MATIAQIVEQIRHAIFGKDVRENIAQGIEQINQDTIDNNERAIDEEVRLNNRIDSNHLDIVQNQSDISNCQTAIANEETRAKREEQRIENLFDMPVEQAVEDWLDAHPEATTTVSDGSITKAKLNDEVSNDAVDLSYYKEVTISTERYNDTDYYYVTIPTYDNGGNLIKPYVSYDTDYSPLQYAQVNGTTVTTNNGIAMKLTNGVWKYGNFIGKGEVLYSQDISDQDELISKGIGYLSISEDRQTYKDWPITTPLATLTADSTVWNCFTYYCKTSHNGTLIDISELITNEEDPIDLPDPNMAMGIKDDKTIIIMGCDGRSKINSGLTATQMAQKLIDLGCVDTWMMDGGGSNNITYRGSKINRNYDSDGTVDRKIKFTFNVKKETQLESVTDIFAKIGEEKQRIIQQIIPNITFQQKRYNTKNGSNLNDIVDTSFFYSIRGVNRPSGAGNYGFVLTGCSNGINDDVRTQIYMQYVDNVTSKRLYMRQCLNGTWTNWSLFSAQQYGHIDMNITGVELTGTEGNYHYKEIAIPSPTTITGEFAYIGVVLRGVGYTDLNVSILNNNVFLWSNSRTAVPTPTGGRYVTVRVHYIAYLY